VTNTSSRTEHLFIVRVWQEPSQSAPAHWRGSVEHVPSGQRVYFESLNDLTDFIALRLNGGAQECQAADENPITLPLGRKISRRRKS
jgi:hypothetical protein